MPCQRQKVPTAQVGPIAFTARLQLMAAVALQLNLAELPAAATIAEATGVVIIFQRGLGWRTLQSRTCFQQQMRRFKVVVPTTDPVGPGGSSQTEAFYHWLVGDHTGALAEADRLQLRKAGLIVTEHQHVTLPTVLKVKMQPLFLTQALNKVQIGFVVLGAVAALAEVGIKTEAPGIAVDGIFPQHAADDLLN